MVQLTLRRPRECFGDFSAPRSPGKIVERLRINLQHFLANYAAVVLLAFVAATVAGQAWVVAPAGGAVLAHAVLKTPNFGAKIADAFKADVGSVKRMFKK